MDNSLIFQQFNHFKAQKNQKINVLPKFIILSIYGIRNFSEDSPK